MLNVSMKHKWNVSPPKIQMNLWHWFSHSWWIWTGSNLSLLVENELQQNSASSTPHLFFSTRGNIYTLTSYELRVYFVTLLNCSVNRKTRLLCIFLWTKDSTPRRDGQRLSPSPGALSLPVMERQDGRAAGWLAAVGFFYLHHEFFSTYLANCWVKGNVCTCTCFLLGIHISDLKLVSLFLPFYNCQS